MNLNPLSHLAILAALAGCGDNGPTSDPDGPPADPDATPDPGPAAIARFRDVFENRRFTELPGALDQLAAANAASPHDPATVLTLGLANLWGVAEWQRDPPQGNLVPARVTALLGIFPEAMTLRPEDYRIHGWLGPSMIGAGSQLGDQQMIANGIAMLAEGVELYPEFNLFVHGLVFQSFPATTPEFASAVDAYFETLDVCFGPVTRANPDITPYLGNETQTGIDRVCWDGPLGVHNFEGYFLHMGDALVKAGDVDAARVTYRNATLLPAYDAWPYKAVLADRLATIEARAALYADADPTNDPLLIGDTEHTCSSCHAAN